MALSPTSDDFWQKVEHRMMMTQPMSYRLTMLMLQLGISIVSITAAYLVLHTLVQPAQGYFLFRAEMNVPPILWALVGLAFIFGGAFVRFRAMGPIAEELKNGAKW